MNATDAMFYIAVLIMSVVIHEVAHGYVALWYGDKTALHAKRLTLNPVRHLDLFGSIIIPLVLFLANSPFMFGWAKPVPYNPDNLSDKKWGSIAVAAAGIVANFSIAIVFGLFLRFASDFGMSEQLVYIVSLVVIVNLILAIFNLIPLPPLDGSKILFPLLPLSFQPFLALIEQYSFVLLILFVMFVPNFIYPALSFFFTLITGLYF